MYLKRPFKIGTLEVPNNIFYSPLAGCSDYPYRKMSSLYRPGLFFCEMVKMDAVVRHDIGTYRILDYSTDMHPIGAQLVGSNLKAAAPAARILEELGFDLIDLNCGCPVDKVTKDKSGSGLLRDLALLGDVLSEIVQAVKVPVTVKIRAGWDENSIVAKEVVKIAEEAGAKALTIHARTREQGYSGSANWAWIKEAKETATKIPIIGNGDVTSPQTAEALFKETGCDAILIGRGTMGSPWIVEEILHYFLGQELIERGHSERLRHFQEHFQEVLAYSSNKKAVLDARRIGCYYLKSAEGTRQFRSSIARAQSIDEVHALIMNAVF